jgi:valyl-tRNA synthetase
VGYSTLLKISQALFSNKKRKYKMANEQHHPHKTEYVHPEDHKDSSKINQKQKDAPKKDSKEGQKQAPREKSAPYNPKEAEKKWQEYWEKNNIYKFDPDSDKEIYSIDTPPPTLSGSMHIGHSFSYSQTDFIARFQRMNGKNVFYPFGTDDNGIATERLMEKMNKIKATSMSRPEFTQLCLTTLEKIRPDFVQDWKNLAISCDFSIFYSTINDHCRRISQKSFIDLYKAGREYRKDAPALYCPECQTAVSQVECDDKDIDSFFNEVIFKIEDEDVIIATTRPEYLPACVAVFYHPEDKRYQKYEGKKAKVPLFDFEVPILADKRVDPEKGTGIVMCCTFGDQTDMEWYYAYNLELKTLLTKDGKITDIGKKYAGMKVHDARKEIIEELKGTGLLIKQTKITHPVKTHERCGTEIEIIHSKQWFIKYLDLKEEILDWGAKLNWYPKHMKIRYDNWIKGLQWDWLISRQRFHGITFPVWYCKECDEVILADESQLPIDPMKDMPLTKKCPKCGCTEFIPEKDVFDTWATSSLTPQITIELMKGTNAYDKLYPMTIRPQAHDIITFWLFNTVVKSQLHSNINPWRDVVISGHALDPNRNKMSKSKGNTIKPQEMVEKYSADALRYWAAGSKLGDDLPFQEKDLITGMKTITKLWNVSKFALNHLEGYKNKKPEKTEAIDRWMLSKLNRMIKESTETFARYEYSRTKSEVDKFFWQILCDNYLEFIKHRLYNPTEYPEDAVQSAKYTLYKVVLASIKLFAPIMPHITEEIYHLQFSKHEHCNSIHLSHWPTYDANLIDKKAEKVGDLVVYAATQARKAKSEKALSLKAPIKHMLLKAKLSKDEFEQIRQTIMTATGTEKLEYEELDEKSAIDYEDVIQL